MDTGDGVALALSGACSGQHPVTRPAFRRLETNSVLMKNTTNQLAKVERALRSGLFVVGGVSV